MPTSTIVEVVTSTVPVLFETSQYGNIFYVGLVILVTALVKMFVGDRLSERVKDIVYPILTVILSGLGIGTGLISTESISDIIAYLAAPSGVYITIKKVLGLGAKK
jgi:uncharacterized membrane protein YqgA involved in biofilm formation